MKNKVYVTNSIPYVNAPPHIGHALEFVQSDIIVRFYRLLGHDVRYLCGSDDNALKNVQAAEKAGVPTQKFVDENAKGFQKLAKNLEVHFDVFQHGSDQKTHHPASQKLWSLCAKNGDIYEKEYEGLYCVGCETFYTADELDEKGECFEHPGRPLETVKEKNYFFKLSKYREKILDLVETDKLQIIPKTRKNEVVSFLNTPVHDISISRSNGRAKNWGVPVPNDPSQRMYVWFDALNIYQSGIGFGWDEKEYQKWWPADVHVIGKGIVRFHAVYWPAFLLSSGLEVPKSLFVHGYITVDGQKMSKTVGNVLDPFSVIEAFGADAVRYYLLREIPAYDDGDFSVKRMQELYNSELANELGNLVTRLTTLGQTDGLKVEVKKPSAIYDKQELSLFEEYQFNRVIEEIWKKIRALNRQVDDAAPWKKEKAERASFLIESIKELHHLAYKLLPFIPQAAEKIINTTSGAISKVLPLFPKA